MVEKNECDLIWKIIYDAILIPRFTYGCKFTEYPTC